MLVVDDEPDIINNIADYFQEYKVVTFDSSSDALKELQRNYYDVIISDYKMPKLTGYELLLEAKKYRNYYYGILLTAYADKDLLENVLNEDLVHKVIEKPLNLKLLKHAVDEAYQVCTRQKEEQKKQELLASRYEDLKREWEDSFSTVIGFNKGLKEVCGKVESVSRLSVNVLLTGETGSGKEVIASLIHKKSLRNNGPFIKVNCSAIPDHLFESELFGYMKGSFTGAMKDKAGKIELADGGTLFLDEIGEMKLDMQAKLLRVLQERELCRVGGHEPIKIDFRLIAATNRDFGQTLSKKEFREDLYYRINEFPIHLPPLRERKDDIPDLIVFFIDKFCRETGLVKPTLDVEVFSRLQNYPWYGNVRELENAVKRALILLNNADKLSGAHFNFLFINSPCIISYQDALDRIRQEILLKKNDLKGIEKDLILSILGHFDNNVQKAVESTSIPKDRFYRNK